MNFADSRCGRDKQAEWGLAGARTRGCYTPRRSGIAGGKAWLIGTELGRLVVLPVLHDRVEGAAVCTEDFLDALCRAAGDVGDFCTRGRRKSVKDKSVTCGVADSDAI